MLLSAARSANLLVAAISILPFAVAQSVPSPCTIELIAGVNNAGRFDGASADQIELLFPSDFDFGPDGSIYIADTGSHVVLRVFPDGAVERFAGTGEPGEAATADGALARSVALSSPTHVRVAQDGTVYFTESIVALRRVRPDGVIETVVRALEPGKYGVGETVEESGIGYVDSIDSAPDESVVFSGASERRIFKLSPDGSLRVIAGTGDRLAPARVSGDGGPATEAGLSAPDPVSVAPDGTIYSVGVGARRGSRIRRIGTDGVIETYMTRERGLRAEIGELREDTGMDAAPSQISVDLEGRLHWPVPTASGRQIKRVGLDDRIELAFELDGISSMQALRMRSTDAYFLSRLQLVRASASTGAVEPLAGVGLELSTFGDGGPALEARFMAISGLTVDRLGRVVVLDPLAWMVRMIEQGTIRTIARGDDSVPTPYFSSLRDAAVAPDGSVFVADGRFVRRIEPNGDAETYAGNGENCFDSRGRIPGSCGDGGLAIEAPLSEVREVEVDQDGRLYILASENRPGGPWVRVVEPDGRIHTLSDQLMGEPPAVSATALTLAADGDPIVAGYGEIFRFDEQSGLTRIPTPGSVQLSQPLIAASPTGDLYIAQFPEGVIHLRQDGSSSILLPYDNSYLARGDSDRPRDASTGAIAAIATDQQGNLYLSDGSNKVIRRIVQPHKCPQVERPQITSITNAQFVGNEVGLSKAPAFAQGSLFSIFGRGLGPAAGIVATPNEQGFFPTSLAGTSVLVDRTQAPIIYASETQVNAIIPFQTEALGRYEILGSGLQFYTPNHRSDIVIVRDAVDSDP